MGVARTDKMKFTLLSLFLVTITLASVSAKFNWFIASQEEDCSNIKKTSGNHEKDHGPMKSCKEDNENICFCANKGGTGSMYVPPVRLKTPSPSGLPRAP